MRAGWIIRQFISDFFATEEKVYGDWYDKRGKLIIHAEKGEITLSTIDRPLKWKVNRKGRQIEVWSDGFDYDKIDFSLRKNKLFLYFRSTGEATVLFKRRDK